MNRPPVTITIPPPDDGVITNCTEIMAVARALAITTAGQYMEAGEHLKAVKGARARVAAEMKTVIDPLNLAIKNYRNQFQPGLDALDDAEATLKRGMVRYQDEQDAIRREAERQAAEAARRERERLAREAAAAAEKARLEREAAEAKARELEAAGRQEMADARRAAADERERQRMADVAAAQAAAAAMPLTPVVHVEQPKVAGQSMRTNWSFEIVDAALIPREFLMVDEKKIGAVVRAMKDSASIPGVRVFAERNIASRSA